MPHANRIIIRRFRLADADLQIWPPGFFASLFVSIAGLERHSRRVKIFSDGMEVVANYRHLQMARTALGATTSPLELSNTNKIQIIVSRFETYFDVIIAAGPNTDPSDARAWERLQQIRALLYPTSDYSWHRNVRLEEYCVHPSDTTCEMAIVNVFAAVKRWQSRTRFCSTTSVAGEEWEASIEEMKSFYYGEINSVAAEEDTGVNFGSNLDIEKRSPSSTGALDATNRT